ncbi:YicS family protein [Enterobacter asburiae]|uniref:YicS family protein n=1 Tax=Enterobacter asburiae TaxID=61645 RepID=UPI003D9C5124
MRRKEKIILSAGIATLNVTIYFMGSTCLLKGVSMKAAHLVCLLVCLLFAAFVHAQEKEDPAKEAQIKQQVLKDIKKTCTPQKKQSDKAWQEMILSSEANQLLIKNAITAVKRDNLDAYWDAVSQVDCMEDY